MAKKAGVGRASLEAMIDRGRSDKDFYEDFNDIGDKIQAEMRGVDAFGNQLEMEV